MAEVPSVCEHVHLPMQSGSSRMLKRMLRRYTREGYLECVDRIRRAMPGVALTTDIIVGFPGETHAEFAETFRFIDELPFTYLHVFTYSARPGPPAAEAPDQVPMPVRKQRNRELRELADRKHLRLREGVRGGPPPGGARCPSTA